MKRSADSAHEADDRVREIPQWARRYAQNRTLPVVAMLVIGAAAFCLFGGLGLLTGWAYVEGKRVLAAASMLVLCGFTVWWVWFCFMGVVRIMRGITERLYQGEGGAVAGACAGIGEHKGPLRSITERLYRGEGGAVAGACAGIGEYKGPLLAAFLLQFCVLASIGLGLLGFLPIRYMQPVSALYAVPFLCYLGLKLRPVGSPFMFLWPGLYAIHAVLVVTGVPIGMGPMLDMVVPTFGYGLVAMLSGHIYSRVALRRLRRLAASPELSDGG